jgi:phosphoglycerol transferase MdoB-like AlkP superfamily enzyme
VIAIYLEVANIFFFEEFSTRLNYIFVQYLQYPKEVFDMIFKSYSIEIIILIPILIFAGIKSFYFFRQGLAKSSIIKKLILFPFILVILFLGIRSSVDSSTPNQSFYSYSNSSLKNDITNNTIFSLLYSIYLTKKEKTPYFGKLNTKKILDYHQTIHSTYKPKDKVVLIGMESFGSTFVGSLGGTPTTPYFDKMAKDGLFASNMYSSGSRTNRGIEAMWCSIFPIFGDSYLKLTKSQYNFWTIARTFKKHHYQTVFLYGGDSKFDNMKGFALNNGFDKVVDKYDFDSSIKRYTWGVSDEELYKKAKEILSQSKQPIFLFIMTLSSHKPFDYPANKIKYYPKAPIESFANSIKYADFALGKFYQDLKDTKFFDSGALAMVADHNAYMSGVAKIPVKEYKIPALFIAKDLKPKELKGVTHQIDVAPTLIDIAGISETIPAMGLPLTKYQYTSALILNRGAYAYVVNDKFVLYQPNLAPIVYNFDYQKIDADEELIQKGLQYIYGVYEIYDKQLHK